MEDILKIKSDFAKGIIAGLLSRKIKSTTGVNADIRIKDLEVCTCEESDDVRIKLNVEGSCKKDILQNLF